MNGQTIQNRQLEAFEVDLSDFLASVVEELDITDELNEVYRYINLSSIKNSLCYVYIDEENIVASDSQRLIVRQNNTSLKKALIHGAIIDSFLLKGEKLFIGDGCICYRSNDVFYKSDFKNISYINYKKVIPKRDEETVVISMNSFLDDSILCNSDEGLKIRVYQHSSGFLCIYEDYIEREFDSIYINSCCLPVIFEKALTKVVVMPIVVKSEDIISLLRNKDDLVK